LFLQLIIIKIKKSGEIVMKIKEIIRKELRDNLVDTIFTLPAYFITELTCYLKSEGINVVEFRNEFNASFATSAYSEVKKQAGILCVNTGPSLLNALTGIRSALKEGIPMVVLVGCQSIDICNDESYFQSINLGKDSAKEVYTLTIDSINLISEVFNIANSAPKGPVILKVPHDLLNTSIPNDLLVDNSMDVEFTKTQISIDEIIGKLKTAKRPLFLLGAGIDFSKIRKYIDNFPFQFVSTIKSRKELLGQKKHIGTIGLLGDITANDNLRKCDCLVNIGSRLSERSLSNNPKQLENKTIMSINISESTCSYEYGEVENYKCTSEEFIQKIMENIDKFDFYKEWITNTNYFTQSFLVSNDEMVTTTDVIKILRDLDIPDAIFCIDDGTYTLPALQYLSNKDYIFSGSMAIGGQSIGASIGASFVNEKAKPIVIVGDGGIMSVIGELQTIANYNIKVLIILINNGGYESIKQWFPTDYNEEFGAVNFESICKGFNLNFKRVHMKKDLISSLMNYSFLEPLVLEINVTSENIQNHFVEEDSMDVTNV